MRTRGKRTSGRRTLLDPFLLFYVLQMVVSNFDD